MSTVKYNGRTTVGPSPEIWSRVNVDHARVDPSVGFELFDDFLNYGIGTAGDATDRYYYVEDGAVTILQVATEVGGVIQLLTDGTADDGICLTTGANRAGMVKFTENSGLKVAWEMRIRPSEATTGQSLYCGLAEEGIAVANTMLVDGGTGMVSSMYVGYRVLEADPNGLDAVHFGEESAEVVVAEAAGTLVAATWIKAGGWFDGIKTVHYVVDGVEVGTALVDATDFPDGEELALYLAYKEHSGTAEYVDLDWWRVYQSRREGA